MLAAVVSAPFIRLFALVRGEPPANIMRAGRLFVSAAAFSARLENASAEIAVFSRAEIAAVGANIGNAADIANAC